MEIIWHQNDDKNSYPHQMTCLNPNAPLNGMKVAALEYMLYIL